MATASLFDVGVVTDPGKIRPDNQDTHGFEPIDSLKLKPHTGYIALVADGVGGGARGEEASKMAKNEFIQAYFEDAAGTVPERLQAAAAHANSVVFERAQALGGATMATTLVAAAILPSGQTHIINIGDSRAYLYQQGKVRQLTRDHNVAALSAADPDGAAHARAQNTLTRCIGAEPTTIADAFQLTLARGEHLLLCTDGLTKHLTGDAELEQHLRRPRPAQETAAALVNLANARGGTDNITVMLIKFGADREQLPKVGGDNTPTILPWRLRRGWQGASQKIQLIVTTVILAVVVLALAFLYASGYITKPVAKHTPTITATVKRKATPKKSADATLPAPTEPAPTEPALAEPALVPTEIPLPTVAPVVPPAVTPGTLEPSPTPRAKAANTPASPDMCSWKVKPGETVDTIANALLRIEGITTPTTTQTKTKRESIVQRNNLPNNGDVLSNAQPLTIEWPVPLPADAGGTCPRN